GRYLVLLLSHSSQVGVSRKIEDRKERDRLRKIGEKLKPKDSGLIIRTEAEGHKKQDLEADLKVLLDLRDRLMTKAARTKGPALLHQDLTLVYQVIRDVFTEDVQLLWIDEKSVYDNAVELVKLIAPKLRRRIKLYRGRLPIFHKYGIEGEIDRLLRRKVWLNAGGYISIDQAEAFTAIDVNTGRFTGSKGLEDTIFRTNMEAAEEIGRQLRLRDLGGIIVIDFIDMERARNRDRVMKAFEKTLKKDRQRTKILHLSPLGLIEMTRKRRGESLMGILTETCPHCAGIGRVRRALTIALKLAREACRVAAEDSVEALVIRAAGSVSNILIGDDGARAAALEKRTGALVHIRADHTLSAEEYDVVRASRTEADHLVHAFSRGDEVVLDRVDPPEPGESAQVYGWVDGYRVLVEGVDTVEVGRRIILDQAGRSFGLGLVKGATRKVSPATAEGESPEKSRRRRRPRRKRTKSEEGVAPEAGTPASGVSSGGGPQATQLADKPQEPKRRRRPKRKKTKPAEQSPPQESQSTVSAPAASKTAAPAGEEEPQEAKPKRRRRPRRKKKSEPGTNAQPETGGEATGATGASRAAGSTGPETDGQEQQKETKRRGLLRRGARRLAGGARR
ncbi:MAG: Rne/Rng family ribonuclease, partial [Armatimonadetes bacterium]|nr:Rne/Rng family ribonuclease [Armatimonadota bacterium]